ncbi:MULTISPECIES: DUF3592 domain-containing protein [unclassified Streptomyces]|uniref:DUF3592 domain-containing protein n=1 Tax=unclassified Streptomyces TaxID=2593676 RepID=UPI00224F74BB|nr:MULTISPECIES: DUF3592 domain-containing protein [unclassified Streptomyces]MCX4987324.1 DUF3592 domain-containing protein [Streptomyces sp. NBC_00568]MCX5007543.1 DUF3592 domain-containing protein [Streptomyces sp. NBC_00638]
MTFIALAFVAIASLFVIAPIAMGVTLVNRVRRRTRAQRHGLRTEGRCIRIETVRRSGGGRPSSLRRYYLFEFVTHEGRQVRFEDTAPNTTVPGDLFTVSYLPERPDRATVALPGDRRAQRELGCMLVFLGFALTTALVVAGVGIGVLSLFAGGS